MYQHPSDWHNNQGVIRQAEEQGMGIILMRPLTSGVFQRLMAQAFPDIDAVASDGWSGAAAAQLRALGPVRGRRAGGDEGPRPRGTQFVELNNEISDDVVSRIDGHEACLGAARSVCAMIRGPLGALVAIATHPQTRAGTAIKRSKPYME